METQVVRFNRERDTKSTIRYQEEADEGKPNIIGTLYVQKFVLGKNPPEQLVVTIKAV